MHAVSEIGVPPGAEVAVPMGTTCWRGAGPGRDTVQLGRATTPDPCPDRVLLQPQGISCAGPCGVSPGTTPSERELLAHSYTSCSWGQPVSSHAPSSKLRAPSFKLQAPRSKLQAPISKPQAPSSKFQALSSDVRGPSSKLQVPSSELHAVSSG